MADQLVGLAGIAAVVALSFGIWAALWRQRYTTLATIGAIVAASMILLSGRHLQAAILYNETPMLIYFGFEASVVVAFALMMFGIRVPRAVVVLQAAINVLLIGALVLFLFVFRLPLLI